MSRSRRRPFETAQSQTAQSLGGGRVAAFGEMLVVGLVVAAASVPLITLVPALAAGARHMDNHVSGSRDTVADLLRLVWKAIRSGWLFGLISAAAIALLLVNTTPTMQSALPGGGALAWISGILAVTVMVFVCRTAGLWEPGRRWRDLWREGRDVVLADPIGDSYVVAGLVVSATVVWMLAPLVVVAPGLIVVAVVAAERRRLAPA